MSSAGLSNFLKALDAVKSDYTCGVCSELCKNPVTLSKCFHIICSEHFQGLKNCPNCNISLDGCSTYVDDRLGSCVESAQELCEIFESHIKENKESSISGKKGKSANTPISMKSATSRVSKKEKTKTLKSTASTSKKAFGDKTNVTKVDNETANTSLLSNSFKLNKALEKRNLKGETMLHVACRLGKIDKISELLNQGANTNTKDNAGWTPLHEVVQNGRLDLVTLLLQYNTLINVPGQGNETPLHEAIRYKRGDIAQELVKNGADMHMRNCKGETPYQLASSELKNLLLAATENIVQTQTINITHMSSLHSEIDSENIRIHCVSESRTVHNKLKSLSKHHVEICIDAKFTKDVTHLIVDADDDYVCTSSLDVLQGIVNSLWILSTEWVIKSSEDKLVPFEKHEIIGVGTKSNQGPKNARYNKYKQLPGIFDGCHFYLHNFNTKYEITKSIVVTKTILTKLITDGGGVALRRVPRPESIPEAEQLVPYHANKSGKLVNCSHYILFKDMYEPMYNMSHLKALPIGWFIECIEKYELCEPW